MIETSKAILDVLCNAEEAAEAVEATIIMVEVTMEVALMEAITIIIGVIVEEAMVKITTIMEVIMEVVMATITTMMGVIMEVVMAVTVIRMIKSAIVANSTNIVTLEG